MLTGTINLDEFYGEFGLDILQQGNIYIYIFFFGGGGMFLYPNI